MKSKMKLILILSILICSSFSAHKPSVESTLKELEVIKRIITDPDIRSYTSCKLSGYPFYIQYSGKDYVLTDSLSFFKTVSMEHEMLNPPLQISSFKFKDERTVKLKMLYLDRKINISASRISLCHDWKVRSFLARRTGEWIPELYILK